jgi:hypothetical protein
MYLHLIRLSNSITTWWIHTFCRCHSLGCMEVKWSTTACLSHFFKIESLLKEFVQFDHGINPKLSHRFSMFHNNSLILIFSSQTTMFPL